MRVDDVGTWASIVNGRKYAYPVVAYAEVLDRNTLTHGRTHGHDSCPVTCWKVDGRDLSKNPSSAKSIITIDKPSLKIRRRLESMVVVLGAKSIDTDLSVSRGPK